MEGGRIARPPFAFLFGGSDTRGSRWNFKDRLSIAQMALRREGRQPIGRGGDEDRFERVVQTGQPVLMLNPGDISLAGDVSRRARFGGAQAPSRSRSLSPIGISVVNLLTASTISLV
jgi:hypothetical protein